MPTAEAPPTAAPVETPEHARHAAEWMVDATTHRISRRRCRQCDEAAASATAPVAKSA